MKGTKTHAPAAGGSARWLTLLDTYQVQYLILDARHDRALLQAAGRHPAWKVDYDDGESVLLARALAPPIPE